MTRIIFLRQILAFGAALTFLAGCGSDDPKPTAQTPTTAGSGGSGGKTEPLYAVSTAVSVGDDYLAYLTTVPSLAEGSTFNLDNAVEIDPSWIFSQPGQPYVYVASMLAPTIVRYTVGADGSLAKDKTVDFTLYGLQSAYLSAAAPIYSDEKSYFIDDSQDQVVIWNPKLMEVIGTIPLGNSNEGTLPPTSDGSIVLHNGLLLTVSYWSDPEEDPSVYGSHVRLIGIDPKTDQIVESTTDERLNYAVPQGHGSDGSLFYSPDSFISSETEVGAGHGSPSHVLRIGPKESTFDRDFDLDLSSLVGGRPAGNFTLLDDRTALIRAWHSELADPITLSNWKDVLWTQAGFMWWRWHVGDAEATLVPDQAPGALGASLFAIDGQTYIVHTSADATSTTLDIVDAQGSFRSGLTGPGQFFGNVVRVR